ncbi:MAG TPA: pyridoxal-phosphate dependent enzyme [Thermomicrobiales bacterium]|nr:pyridoxal-phosphate dependent enzyme [Thermomicrobiales bacterium]
MPDDVNRLSDLVLRCSRCGHTTAASAQTWRCPACAGPLAWDGPAVFNRSLMAADVPSLWRYGAVLPVSGDLAVSLGESMTPLVGADVDAATIKFKLDFLLPSGSYKDRGAAVLLSALRALGVRHAVEDSSGNAAAAIAAYAARAGIDCTVFAPATASAGKLVQAAAYGATVERVEGSRDDVANAAIAAAAADSTATYASHNWHPFFIEGVKTWALEVWEQLGYRAPDNVVVPVGSGSMLLGAHLAFGQLRAGGEIERLPRLFAAQPAACAPLHAAFLAGADDVTAVERRPTLAEGASIARPVRGRELLAALRESHGQTAAVEEDEIATSLRDLARQGIYVEPTSAVAAAGVRQLLARGEIQPSEVTVVMLTGSGLKATETIRGLL